MKTFIDVFSFIAIEIATFTMKLFVAWIWVVALLILVGKI